MRMPTSRRGSALLIVLGMLSFMIVSAVGFAAYMRYSRLPSSYLRRSSASRMLVKAAVAQAIDAVDRAVNNNPHPGIGELSPYGENRNIWRSRVLFGTNNVDALCSEDPAVIESASPLSLEGLAYIPPPLVNEARYYSKFTPTAQWQSFGFDVGRYSYLVLDVSDYFDINRLMADLPRSSAPNARISLAYMFERGRDHKGSGTGAAEWDQFMEQFRTFDDDTLQVDFKGKFPLVSVADFNLALGRKGKIGNFDSPFYKYITEGGGQAGFYGTESIDDEDRIRRMAFVTDGWFPQGREDWNTQEGGAAAAVDEDDLLDLNDSSHQPFAMNFLNTKGKASPSLSATLMSQSMQEKNEWIDRLGGLGGAALFDYLDTDHVPVSLAIPTTERVPMICGIRPQFEGSSFGVRKEVGEMTGPGGGNLNTADPTRQVEVVVKYKIDSAKFVPGFQGGDVKTLVVYPFNHADDSDSWPCSMDGRFSMFFSSERMSLRTGGLNDVLHLAMPTIANSGIDQATGLMNVKLEAQAVAKFTNISEPADAVKEFSNRLMTGAGALGTAFSMEGNELLRVTYTWTQVQKNSTGGVTAMPTYTPEFDQVWRDPAGVGASAGLNVQAHTAFKAVKANGTLDDTNFSDNALRDFIMSGTDKGPKMILNAAVWLRIRSNDGKTLDMVPASLLDDKVQNNVNDAQMIYQGLSGRLGTAHPLMLFDPQVEFTLSIDALNDLASTPKTVKLTPESALVADPRFNHAPENWFAHAGNLTKETWLNNNHAKDNGRDGDIFMATSDAGYMQSKYELAFLPRFTNLKTFGGDAICGNLPSFASLQAIPSSFTDTRQKDFMWRMYDPFDEDEDAFDDLPWTSEGSGFKVNPYSDSRNVLLAAFANTPVDWKRASTNIVQGAKDYSSMSSAEFNKEYAWNAYTSGENNKISWDTLEKLADNFMSKVRARQNWREAWQDMDWFGDRDTFCGVNLDGDTDDLWTADRKFLYGYWRDCFAAKQQLYIVFVRAEPLMMGGSAKTLAPPQLSTKAMAVVWRDPSKSKEDRFPHQTRVLFYRQFE